ncbi:MAG: hypothetical protein P4L40_11825 [Terracidiphilus sp.]|nr:hypothetical protein [Terracidiphilus sp.]
MSIVSELNSMVGLQTRRNFLQMMGAAGMGSLGTRGWSALLSPAVRESLARAGKTVTLLEDGGFEKSAWGWQFTDGAKMEAAGRQAGHGAVHVETGSGDYARFLVLQPEIGKTYTLAGWMRTEDVKAQDKGAGAYFAAVQYEFQGRPTEYTVDGKQIPEKHFGNYTGTHGWQRFSQSFTCLPGTAWFEVVLGIYRGSGKAWFADLTFVEGDKAVAFEDTVDYWRALEWAHREALEKSGRTRASAAILRDTLPVRGAASDPQRLAKMLSETYDVTLLDAADLANTKRFNRAAFDLLVLPYGESFPLAAREPVEEFLRQGGNLLSTGGYAFLSPVVEKQGKWIFNDDAVKAEHEESVLPAFAASGAGWKALEPKFADAKSAELPDTSRLDAGVLRVPMELWQQTTAWYYDVQAGQEKDQYALQGWLRTEDVKPAPDGYGFARFQQLDEKGNEIYAAGLELEQLTGTHAWHKVQRLFYVAPGCKTIRVSFGLNHATGTLEGAGFRMEPRSAQVRINTALGFPQDDLQVEPGQIGMFDADFRLKRVATIRAAEGQPIVTASHELHGAFEGYAATCVLGMSRARWTPLLEAYDGLGRRRGAAGALVHHQRGVYARSSWAFFGVENADIFTNGSKLGEETLRAVSAVLANPCWLHACEADFACYRQGEPVRLHVLVTNMGRATQDIEVRWRVAEEESTNAAYQTASRASVAPGQTIAVETAWHASSFAADCYRVTAELVSTGRALDRIETGFVVWSASALKKGLAFEFKQNYFQVEGRSLFLQGTDDYLHTFLSEDEHPLTWREDAQGCRDSCIDVYENLMGMRGPQQRPTKTWWRWIDAMLLNVQQAGGAFFPGMLIFSNTAVNNKDLADQAAYVRAFAARYKDAPGLMYYLNGDLELHDPNLPDIQKLYNEYLKDKYGTDEALRKAWTLSPPEAPIGQMTIRAGKDDWRDVRTLDDFEFRTRVVERWLNTLHDSIRTVDTHHPVTAEFYQLPYAGIDLLHALGKLELANFGYFNAEGEDFYRFPQVCKFLDQRVRGKGINIGEFGVKTHPAWFDSADYIAARSEAYEQAYFMAIAHYGFALGASKIQNWCWKYPSDLPFEWGINYPNELVGRDVRAVYRNTGLFFRRLRPHFEPSDVLFLIPGENRKGGKGTDILAGLSNGIRLLIDQRIAFNSLADEYIDELPARVKTIFYPLAYCPDEKVVARLKKFVEDGGQLYLSGDISYDTLRQRTQTHRLTELCGVEFVQERFADIDYANGAAQAVGKSNGWPDYTAFPGIVTRLAGAKSLVETHDGVPVVTEFALGRGRVLFSTDPIELHGDPRYQSYAHAFYAALCADLGLSGEVLEPPMVPVHRFRVPAQDQREITVLVNYSKAEEARAFSLPTAAGRVELTLKPMLSGAVVVNKDKGVEAVESSADVRINGELVIASDAHFMAISLDEHALARTAALLLLPMGEGALRLANASRWKSPTVLAGEVKSGMWKQQESFCPQIQGGLLEVPVAAQRAFSMLIVCETGAERQAIEQVERTVTEPWSLA